MNQAMKNQKTKSKQVQMVLEVLQAEVDGNVDRAISIMDKDYTQTWIYKDRKGNVFPRWNFNKRELEETYHIKGRKYDIKHITEGKNVVMVEMVESYPDPNTKKVYRTPLVIIVEFKNGKIVRGRHYCDPQLSHMFLSKSEVQKAYN